MHFLYKTPGFHRKLDSQVELQLDYNSFNIGYNVHDLTHADCLLCCVIHVSLHQFISRVSKVSVLAQAWLKQGLCRIYTGMVYGRGFDLIWVGKTLSNCTFQEVIGGVTDLYVESQAIGIYHIWFFGWCMMALLSPRKSFRRKSSAASSDSDSHTLNDDFHSYVVMLLSF